MSSSSSVAAAGNKTPQDKRKIPVTKITPQRKMLEYKNKDKNLKVHNEKLICTLYKVEIDYKTKSTIDQHLKTGVHKNLQRTLVKLYYNLLILII